MSGIKLVFLLAILAAGAVGGLLPLRRRLAAPALLSRGNALAAGIFLGAGWMHMLPEAAEGWRALSGNAEWAYGLAAVGFLLMLASEHVLLPESAHALVHAPSSERFRSLDRPGRSGRAAYAVLLALSVHSLMAGLALGAEGELPEASVLFVAILAHKSIAGFALGVSLARSPLPSRRRLELVGVFAVATPIGMLLGAGLGGGLEGSLRLAAEATVLALAAGTFVYVALLDILRDELTGSTGRLPLFGLVIVGVAAMGVLAVWV
ncbi:MAG: ZIP family transporter [Myxococcota bacterium]